MSYRFNPKEFLNNVTKNKKRSGESFVTDLENYLLMYQPKYVKEFFAGLNELFDIYKDTFSKNKKSILDKLVDNPLLGDEDLTTKVYSYFDSNRSRSNEEELIKYIKSVSNFSEMDSEDTEDELTVEIENPTEEEITQEAEPKNFASRSQILPVILDFNTDKKLAAVRQTEGFWYLFWKLDFGDHPGSHIRVYKFEPSIPYLLRNYTATEIFDLLTKTTVFDEKACDTEADSEAYMRETASKLQFKAITNFAEVETTGAMDVTVESSKSEIMWLDDSEVFSLGLIDDNPSYIKCILINKSGDTYIGELRYLDKDGFDIHDFNIEAAMAIEPAVVDSSDNKETLVNSLT
jgi:hypothetical protein